SATIDASAEAGDAGACGGATCLPCDVPADCPAPSNECVVATCRAHTCGTSNLGTDHLVNSGYQTPGDCKQVVCNGHGFQTIIDDPTDTPATIGPCWIPACAGSPLAATFLPAPMGMSCSNGSPPTTALLAHPHN